MPPLRKARSHPLLAPPLRRPHASPQKAMPPLFRPPEAVLLPPIEKLGVNVEAIEEELSRRAKEEERDRPPRLIEVDLLATQRKVASILAEEKREATKLERELNERAMRGTLHRSSSSYQVLKNTSLEPLRRQQEDRGERKFYIRHINESQKSKLRQKYGEIKNRDGTVPWRPVAHPSRSALRASAEDLLLDGGPELLNSTDAAHDQTLCVSPAKQAELMYRGGLNEDEAYRLLMRRELRKVRRLDDFVADEEDEEDEDPTRTAILEALGGGQSSLVPLALGLKPADPSLSSVSCPLPLAVLCLVSSPPRCPLSRVLSPSLSSVSCPLALAVLCLVSSRPRPLSSLLSARSPLLLSLLSSCSAAAGLEPLPPWLVWAGMG